jgi:hypothetical protein
MQRTISWNNPTTYTDGTPIETAEAAILFVHVWRDSMEVYQTLPNVTTFPIEVNPGVTNMWQLQAEVNGQKSELSPAYSYTEPFQVPMSPVALSVS